MFEEPAKISVMNGFRCRRAFITLGNGLVGKYRFEERSQMLTAD